ncbi:MAG: hypothetical protein ACLQUZ_06450 [Rhizomicrobium sp.]
MPQRRKRSIAADAEIDGFALRWTLRHDPQWSPRGDHKGMAISVRLDDSHRELLLEYPFPKTQPAGIGALPERPKISPGEVASDIRRAIAAGWNPVSRGRPFVFQVPEDSK